MQQEKLWSRIGHWLRPFEKPNGKDFANTGADAPDLDFQALADHRAKEGVIASAPREAIVPHSTMRATKRELSLERLQEGYDKVVNLVESIQGHLAAQDRRSEAMTRALETMNESMTRVSETSLGQLENLTAMREQIEADSVRAAKLEQQLAQMPSIADAQRETMASIGRQLDASSQTSDRVATTLGGFEEAVSSLAGATENSTEAFRKLHAVSTFREEKLARLLDERAKQLTRFAFIAVAFALLAATVSLIALLR